MEYKWKEIGEETDFNYELDTPIGKFAIRKNNDCETHDSRYQLFHDSRKWLYAATLEEGKEQIEDYLKDRTKELQEFLLQIEVEKWKNKHQVISAERKISDDSNYLKGFYDGVNIIHKTNNNG